MDKEKVEKFYGLAMSGLTPLEASKKGLKTQAFIEENLDEIESYYNDCMAPNSGAQLNETSESQVVRNAITSIKLDKFIKLATAGMSMEEKFEKGSKTRSFIRKNLDEVEAFYDDSMHPDSLYQQTGTSEEKIVQDALKFIRSEQLFKIAYGDMTPDEQFISGVSRLRPFIASNLTNIEAYISDNSQGELSPEIIKQAVASTKRELSTKDIRQATENVSRTSKDSVATEETRNSNKEEVSLDD